MTEQDPRIQQLQQSLVESLMAVIGAPDDEEIARTADEVARELDDRMSAEPESFTV